jgi:hypothetical protein
MRAAVKHCERLCECHVLQPALALANVSSLTPTLALIKLSMEMRFSDLMVLKRSMFNMRIEYDRLRHLHTFHHCLPTPAVLSDTRIEQPRAERTQHLVNYIGLCGRWRHCHDHAQRFSIFDTMLVRDASAFSRRGVARCVPDCTHLIVHSQHAKNARVSAPRDWQSHTNRRFSRICWNLRNKNGGGC